MILVGDIGGTSTRLARARVVGPIIEIESIAVYSSSSSPQGFEPLLQRYLREHPGSIESAAFGMPGPVADNRVVTTNLPWEVDGHRLSVSLGVPVRLLNDLEAAAHGVFVVPPHEVVTLQPGTPVRGNLAVIAAGTGLGQAIILRQGHDLVVSPSEGGHTEFGPRDEEEVALWRFLQARFGHVSYERLVSGPGLINLYEFYAQRAGDASPPWQADEDRGAAVARAAQSSPNSTSGLALSRFCAVFGAEAGNLALKALAREGVFVAGGVAKKILPVLQSSAFLSSFADKGRYAPMMRQIPVRVVTDDLLALRGAARAAL